MTDDNNFEDDKTPLEQAINAVENDEDNPDSRDQLTRIFDALSIISLGVREVKSAAQNIRKKEMN